MGDKSVRLACKLLISLRDDNGGMVFADNLIDFDLGWAIRHWLDKQGILSTNTYPSIDEIRAIARDYK